MKSVLLSNIIAFFTHLLDPEHVSKPQPRRHSGPRHQNRADSRRSRDHHQRASSPSAAPHTALQREPPASNQPSPPDHIRSATGLDTGVRASAQRTVTALLRRHCRGPVAVLGVVPCELPSTPIFFESSRPFLPAPSAQVPGVKNWPVAMALSGFDYRRCAVWVLRLEKAGEPMVMRHLKALATTSEPSTVVILLSKSSFVGEMAESAGFSLDAKQSRRPVFLLRRKECLVHSTEPRNTCASLLHNQPVEKVRCAMEV